MAKIALLIGVSEYLPEFPALPSAVKDVEAMKEVLGNSEMGGFDDIKVLKNSNRQEIEEAIYELFANRNKDDVLLFYFSGHGVKSREGNLFLATPQTRKDQRGIVTPTAVGASFLQTEMNNSFSQRLVVILDCCYSGAFTKGMTAKGDENIDIQAELGGKGRAILMSSSSTQSSFQSEGSELSIYTKYIVEGIKTGAADTDNNGKISADELHQYVSEKVHKESPAMTPQFAPVKEGYRIYLASSPQDEPKLQYRRKVQEILQKNNGNIDFLNRFLLDELRQGIELSHEEAEVIETEEMEPYILFRKKLKRYEEIFIQAVEKSYPFTEK
ncbi:MAG: caspase family protein [Microcoleaceae cyanobacterium]